ncbi:MAG: hypothetical protein COU81_02330, partial [Candidatus Portnoybacteria bacterium CG10_big_fil_rev_8_21_14_0_10_36_7]
MDIAGFLLLYVIIVIASVIHEYSHGWTADFLGDPTARYAGRLTLNPIAHMDVWGTVIVPIIFVLFFGVFFGAAKPVPFNPYNLKNQKWGPALVGAAGPLSNLIIAFILGLIINFWQGADPLFVEILKLVAIINISLAMFNLIPIPPLDGSKILPLILPARMQRMMIFTSGPMMFVGIIIAVF